MTSPDLNRLTPSEAAATIRALPRRFRSLLSHPPAADGCPALDHVAAAVRALATADVDLEEVWAHDDPEIDPPTPGDDGGSRSAGERHVGPLLDLLEDTATRLAVRIDATDPEAWRRSGHDDHGEEHRALDIVREAVQAGVGQLHACEAAVAGASDLGSG